MAIATLAIDTVSLGGTISLCTVTILCKIEMPKYDPFRWKWTRALQDMIQTTRPNLKFQLVIGHNIYMSHLKYKTQIALGNSG